VSRISELSGRELAWKGSGCRNPAHELWADGEVVATLRWRGDSLAVAETADGRWSFERPALRRSPVSVRADESGVNVATFGSNWTGGGTLETSRERRFVWSTANFWRSRWAWRRDGGTPLVRFESRQGLVKVEGRVRIEGAARDLPELDLLVALGWYLTVMRAKDTTTDAVAATAGTAGS
jgi:hypothetical protein